MAAPWPPRVFNHAVALPTPPESRRLSVKEVARKFEFIREIASGGFGSVYLAKVIHGDGFSRLVAIKLLHRKWSENDEIASRMRDEARLLGWLRHRNIVDVMDLTVIDGRSAVVMEYLDAADARQLIDHCLEERTRIPLRVALEVCAASAAALDAAYNRPPYAGEKPLRVIHRDIKPSNIMVDNQGLVKVLDFGVARAEFDAREAKTAELSFGSLEYMPPERLFFEPEAPSSDIYSLGAALYEMLSLQKLGKAKLRQSEQERFLEERFEDLVEHHPMPSEEAEDILHDLLRDMLSFDESERPTAADAVVRLRSFARQLDGEGVEEWAERVVPPVVQAARGSVKPSPESMVGRVVTEDISGQLDDPTVDNIDQQDFADLDSDTVLQRPQGGKDTQALLRDDDDMEGSEHSRGRDDERWSALKQATLASLTETGELGPRTVQAVRQVAGFVPQPGSALDDEGETVVIRDLPALLGEETITGHLMADLPPLPPSLHTEKTVVQKDLGQWGAPTPAPANAGEARSGRGGAAIGAVVVMAALVAALVAGLLLLLVVVGLSMQGSGVVPGPVPAPVAVPDPTPSPVPAPAPAPSAIPAGSVVFRSAMPDTKKMKVECGGQSADGDDVVFLPGSSLEGVEACTIIAIDTRRKRRTAEVQTPEAREYSCFAGAEDVCQ